MIVHREQVTEAFEKVWISRYGSPSIIISDRGKEFLNTAMSNLVKKYDIRQKATAAYHPQSNLAEAYNKKLMNKIRILAVRRKLNWTKLLLEAKMKINEEPNSATKISPSEALFGRIRRKDIFGKILECDRISEEERRKKQDVNDKEIHQNKITNSLKNIIF